MNKKSILEMTLAEALAEGHTLDEIQEVYRKEQEKRKEEEKLREAVKTARQAAKSALLDYAVVLGGIENNEEKADLDKMLEEYMIDMEKEFDMLKQLKEMKNKVKLYTSPTQIKKSIPEKKDNIDIFLDNWLNSL